MITFENITTGERVSFGGELDANARQAHIAAFLNSSDLSPNAQKGQDFGWRLAPEIKDEIDRMKSDPNIMAILSRQIGIGIDEIRDYQVLNYIAEQEFAAEQVAKSTQPCGVIV